MKTIFENKNVIIRPVEKDFGMAGQHQIARIAIRRTESIGNIPVLKI